MEKAETESFVYPTTGIDSELFIRLFFGWSRLGNGNGCTASIAVPNESFRSKTGFYQSASVTDDACIKILDDYCNNLAAEESRFFPNLTYRTFRKRLYAALSLFGFQAWGFTPHSFRHGGAVLLWEKDHTVGQIRIRGRWRSLNTVDRYLQLGRSLALSRSFSASQEGWLRNANDRFVTLLGIYD
eukprot:Awhi_evm1s10340